MNYDSRIAYHYAAYRPPLHQLILSRLLSGKRFHLGLDVGCGTGYSTRALKAYCERVLGMESSQQMLAQTAPYPGVEWKLGRAEESGLEAEQFDVVSFAGSLHYCDESKTVSELQRICLQKALILVYDFEVILDEVLEHLGIPASPEKSDYDHEAHFEAQSALKSLTVERTKEFLDVSNLELLHLLLSSQERFESLKAKAWNQESLNRELRGQFGTIPVRLYYRSYTFS